MRVLKCKDIVIRQKAVQWCVELLSVPDFRVRCLDAGSCLTPSSKTFDSYIDIDFKLIQSRQTKTSKVKCLLDIGLQL